MSTRLFRFIQQFTVAFALLAGTSSSFAGSGCGIPIHLDCVTVATNVSKRGFAALLADNQNPTIYFKRATTFGASYRRDGLFTCYSCHFENTMTTADTLEFTSVFVTSPTNTSRSGRITLYSETNGVAIIDCTSIRNASGPDTWSNPSCTYTSPAPSDVLVSNLTATNSLLVLGSVFMSTNGTGHRVESHTILQTNTINLSNPFTLNQFVASVTNALNSLAFPDWTNATRYASASRGGLDVIRPAGDYADFNGGVSRFKYRIPLLGPKNEKQIIRWHEVFLPNGGGAVTNITFTNEVTFNGQQQFVIFPDGTTERIVNPPEIAGRIEVVLDQDWGCTSTTCNYPGAGEVSSGCIDVRIGLGKNALGEPAGFLTIKHDATNIVAHPSILNAFVNHGVQVLRDANGIRQIKAPQCLVDVTNSAYRVELRFYSGGTPAGNGFYQPSGPAATTWTIYNIVEGIVWTNRLGLIRSVNGNATSWQFTWSAPDGGWELLSAGLRKELRGLAFTNGFRTETFLVKRPSDSATVYREVNVWQAWGTNVWGTNYLLVTNKVGLDAHGLTTRWTYYTNVSAADPGYCRVKEVVRPNGGWERYEYTNGGVSKIVSVFGNSAVGSAEGNNRVTLHSYAPVDASDNGSIEPNTPRTTVESVLGQEISRRYRIISPGQVIEIQCQRTGATPGDSDNLFTTNRNYVSAGFDGIVDSVRSPDGTVQITMSSVRRDGAYQTNTVLAGQPDAAGTNIVDGTKATTIINPYGQVFSQQTIAIPSQMVLENEGYGYTDSYSGPYVTTHLDGTATYASYNCCGLESTMERDGVTTSYSYDALHRVTAAVRLGITNGTTFDAAANVLATSRRGTDGSLITINQTTFDEAGRQITAKDALLNTTIFAYANLAAGTSNLTTYPDTGTRIEVFAADGSLLRVTGTGTHPSRFEYGVDADGLFTKEIKLDRNGNDTPEWTKTCTDAAARAYKTIVAGNATNSSFFNSRGQLWKQVDPDGVTATFGYNAKGEPEYTTNGPNRVARVGNTITTNVMGYGVRRSETLQLNDSGVWVYVGLNETSVDGLRSWQVQYGRTNQSQTVYTGTTRTVTLTAPDGTQTTQTFQNGRLVSSQTASTQLGTLNSTVFNYDSHGRQNTATDSRTGTTTLVYNAADQVVTNTLPPAEVGQPAQTTVAFYDSMGRVWRTLLPDGGYVTNAYHLSGELSKQTGVRRYPSEFFYDAQGRMTNLTTWQNYPTGTAQTTWLYSSTNGLLLSKKYQGTNGPSYSHSAAGRLKSRTWARGVSSTNGFNAYGELESIGYTDGTPSVGIVYDRRGRLQQVTQGTNVTVLAFNDAGQLTREPFNGVALTNGYDAFLRLMATALEGQAATLSQSGYDAASRLSGVTNGANTMNIAYVPQSPLVSGSVIRQNGNKRVEVNRGFDNLNRLRNLVTVPSGGPMFLFSYGYNSANQRTNVTLADGSRWVYRFDMLGQLTNGFKFWSDGNAVAGQQFEYGFDTIGNRTATKVGSVGAMRTSSYANDLLNQITSRVVPGTNDVTGSALASATVTVNGVNASRKNDYWQGTVAANNVTGAVNVIVTNRSTTSSATNLVTGSLLFVKTPEVFIHDADGNLTQDGRFNYAWDGENRLKLITPLSGTPTNGWQSVLCGYDWMHRRISKVVSNWSGAAWVKFSEQRFVYEGWNLTAVLDGSSQLQVSFVWGNDLSGTRQGAGGVGGLISMTIHSGTNAGTYFYAYDGNGNVVGMVNATTGQTVAVYEHGPFGELLRATGPLAFSNPFRFSTKFQDDETGLLYYGYRYYNPSTGRWLSRDPIEEVGGHNIYGFICNSPLSRYDAHGQIPLDTLMDAAFLAWDLTTGAGAAIVALDVAALAIPYVPNVHGIAAVTRMVKGAEKQVSFTREASLEKILLVERNKYAKQPLNGKLTLEYRGRLSNERGEKWDKHFKSFAKSPLEAKALSRGASQFRPGVDDVHVQKWVDEALAQFKKLNSGGMLYDDLNGFVYEVGRWEPPRPGASPVFVPGIIGYSEGECTGRIQIQVGRDGNVHAFPTLREPTQGGRAKSRTTEPVGNGLFRIIE